MFLFFVIKDNLEAMDIDDDNAEHKKIWCIGTNQDYEKEYLRLTGVSLQNLFLISYFNSKRKKKEVAILQFDLFILVKPNFRV